MKLGRLTVDRFSSAVPFFSFAINFGGKSYKSGPRFAELRFWRWGFGARW